MVGQGRLARFTVVPPGGGLSSWYTSDDTARTATAPAIPVLVPQHPCWPV